MNLEQDFVFISGIDSTISEIDIQSKIKYRCIIYFYFRCYQIFYFKRIIHTNPSNRFLWSEEIFSRGPIAFRRCFIIIRKVPDIKNKKLSN